MPTQDTIIVERFFDESGGMQLVLHAPFGSRINRAWGLALRKRFCRQFNFELQAAATEDAVLLSLGPQHSFPLADVFRYLHPATARDILVQAFLDAPVFQTRWRWNTTISLAILRNRDEERPDPRDADELHDALLTAGYLHDDEIVPEMMDTLVAARRAGQIVIPSGARDLLIRGGDSSPSSPLGMTGIWVPAER